ncbi:MAG: fatty-acyl-CoA synthase [Alphaproteobacteria bacterium]|jgi:fatty-acyl-CoA synthase
MQSNGFDTPFRNLADVVEFEQQAEDTWLAIGTVYNALCETVAEFGDKIALTALPPGDPLGQGLDISFNTLLAKTNQAGNLFMSAGLEAGESVSYLLPISPQAFYTLLGAETVGAVNAINPMLEPHHILGIAQAANATILVATGLKLNPELWAKAAYVIEHMPNLKAVYVLGGDTECDGVKVFPFDAAMADQAGDKIHNLHARGLDDIIGYYHTGGTTGVPKLVPHTNRMQLIQLPSSGFLMGLTSQDSFLVGLPLFHISGSIITGLIPLLSGVRLVIASPQGFRDKLVISNYWKLVEKYSITVLGAVPTMLSALINIPVGEADISSLRMGSTGGSAAPVEVVKAITAHTGAPMLEGYGMTEVTSFTTGQPRDGEIRVGSVGLRGPYINIKAVIVDENGQMTRDAKTDEIGVIVMKGACVMPGYVQAVHNASAFAGEGWVNTGDLGRIDAEGYIWLTGRAKDLIIRSGHNIDPSMIEEALHEHPAVELAAAVGRPDSYTGEMPVAYVQLKPGMVASPQDLKEFVRARISERAANPAAIHMLDLMPLTGVGKIFKPALRQDAIERVFSAELEFLKAEAGVIEMVVENNPVHGLMARVRVLGGNKEYLEEKIRSRLGAYSVHYEIEWEAD